ncbi:MAG: hypothetical protein ABSH49_15180 [Bryobacteraceae bacterium]
MLGRLTTAIGELPSSCTQVLPNVNTLLSDAKNLDFIDASPGASGSETVAQVAPTLAAYNPSGPLSSIVSGTYAVTLNGPGNSISNVVLLSSNFWATDSYGNNANYSVGQGTALVHELLHYVTQYSDPAFVQNYGISVPQGASYSSAISAWLQNGCKN